jgi:hypothetical protein
MAQLDYFALDEDFYDLMQFVLSETGIVMYEAYSRIDSEIRRVTSVNELRAMADERLAGGLLLRGWFPDVQDTVNFRRFKLNPEVGSHRTSLEGASVMQFAQGRIDRGRLKCSTFSHWNEAGALHRGIPDANGVNWAIMRRYSGRIHRHVRNKLAVAKLQSAAVLPHAYAAVASGLSLWYGQEVKHESPLLKRGA